MTDLSTANMKAMARAQAANGRSGLVILDFGRPACDSRYGAGTLTVGSHVFVSNGSILNAAETYLHEWYINRLGSATLKIALGTSNSCQLGDPCGSVNACTISTCAYENLDLNRWGQHWAEMVNSFATFISGYGYSSYASAAGADDAEPDWNPTYTNTRDVMAGYAGTSQQLLYNYGSLDGFPTTYSGSSFNPNNYSKWRYDQAYEAAYGFSPNVPVPEIYYSSNAPQWENLDRWAVATMGFRLTILGVMTEQPSQTLSYQAAYDAMMSALNSTASTAQSYISYSTTLVDQGARA